MDIAQAIINTALGVTKTLAQWGIPWGIAPAAIMAAMGAAQVAMIASTPVSSGANGKIVPITEPAYECDVLYQGSKPVENKIDGADVFDNSTDFLVAPCSPEKIFISDTSFEKRMAAIIEPNAEQKERDRKAYVGVSYEGQFLSNGIFDPFTRGDAMFVGTYDITLGGLWEKYHKTFADWLAKTRQRVTADVNLSPSELHDFRLYAPVYFKGRKWIVAKLSVTVAAGSEMVTTRGEFIEI